jgi:hypothetical protein
MKIRDDQGYVYHYIHLNNDTPGTDDAKGGYDNAFAPGIEQGVRVTKGQHVAYVGDSGNAETVGSHLHFEIHLPDGTAINPYESLKAALGESSYDVAQEASDAVSINVDRNIVASLVPAGCVSGSLIRSVTSPTVYYCGADGRRYVFPNEKTYFTWYADFAGVATITDQEMSSLMIGGNVTYKPGAKLVKIKTDPKVYAVAAGGVLRFIPSEAVAAALYGTSWARTVEDIPDEFFVNYTVGEPVVL